MKTFDPYTADEQEAISQPNSRDYPWSPHRQWESAQLLNNYKSEFLTNPLFGMAICFQAKLTIPNWLSDSYMVRFNKVNSGQVTSWDAAFTRPFPSGKHAKKPKNGSDALLNFEPVMVGLIHHLFNGPNKYPKTREGRKMAAQQLGITEKQLRDLIPSVLGKRTYERVSQKTRANLKSTPNSANNPFGL